MTMVKQRWMPVISEHTMKYKKGLALFQKYTVAMQVSGWDERSFFMNHQFIVSERVVAEGTSLGVIVSAEGVIEPQRVMDTVRQLCPVAE